MHACMHVTVFWLKKHVYLQLCTVAMQMWTLSRFLPLVIGDIVPKDDQHWVNFLLLLEIMFSRKITKDMCDDCLTFALM